ncbi:hypothetical protein [Bacillus sp. UMB0893]|nr:hypothetical protein [Bacillus sp. UMB0893]
MKETRGGMLRVFFVSQLVNLGYEKNVAEEQNELTIVLQQKHYKNK